MSFDSHALQVKHEKEKRGKTVTSDATETGVVVQVSLGKNDAGCFHIVHGKQNSTTGTCLLQQAHAMLSYAVQVDNTQRSSHLHTQTNKHTRMGYVERWSSSYVVVEGEEIKIMKPNF